MYTDVSYTGLQLFKKKNENMKRFFFCDLVLMLLMGVFAGCKQAPPKRVNAEHIETKDSCDHFLEIIIWWFMN